MRRLFYPILILPLLLVSFFPIFYAHAQELVEDKITIVKGQVIEVLSQDSRDIPGTDTKHDFQTIKVKVLDGDTAGQTITVDNDYLLMKPGEVFYLMHTVNPLEGRDVYSVSEPYRIPTIIFFVGLFVVCLFVFGGKQGIRGLLALVMSFFFISYLLLPGILHGYSPILVSMGVSSLIIILGSYITHGFNRTTTAAVVGMITTIIITGLLAYTAIHSARFTGYTSEEAVYLNFNTRGSIDFVGLLLGSIMIGLLGVLYDAAISQAVAIEELYNVGQHLTRKEIYKRGIRIGREHIGALVNILAIAYVGASLPLLLLFVQTSIQSPITTINQELFSTEIIRTMIGSIGLILAVPITTAVSVFLLYRRHTAKENKDKSSNN